MPGMDKDSSILVTGSTGLIGSALARQLRSLGYTNLLTPTHAELDLLNFAQVTHYFASYYPAYVFHLAARVDETYAGEKFSADLIFQNTRMQMNVLQSAHRFGGKKLLFPGSACTYPRLAEQPIKESAFLSGAIEPSNLAYAVAKVNGIVAAQSYRKQHGFNAIVPMLTTAYGVGDRFDEGSKRFIPALMQRFHDAKSLGQECVIGSDSSLHEFIFSDDVADALVFLMQNYNDESIINVGTMVQTSMPDLAQTISHIADFKGEIKLDMRGLDGTPGRCLDSTRLFELGWRPKVSLEQGLQKMYQHHFVMETL